MHFYEAKRKVEATPQMFLIFGVVDEACVAGLDYFLYVNKENELHLQLSLGSSYDSNLEISVCVCCSGT